jgi:hypothetical protein
VTSSTCSDIARETAAYAWYAKAQNYECYSDLQKVSPLSPQPPPGLFCLLSLTRDILTMPRRILEVVSSNERPRRELDNGEKNRVIRRYLKGARPAIIVRDKFLNRSCVYKLIRRFKERGIT